MSLYKPEDYMQKSPPEPSEQVDDVVIEDIPDEPINLDNIPF